MSDVSILVVTYNGRRHVARFLDSLATTTGVDYELVVVDNASKWPTRRLLRKRASQLDRLVMNDENTLFAPGVNTALAAADPASRYVVLLNPDVVILDPKWLARLLAVHRRGITTLGYVEGSPWTRGDGYCLLIDRDLFRGLPTEYHWWWSVTKLQADLLAAGMSVQAVKDHSGVIEHVGGGSGHPPTNAKGMTTPPATVVGWFAGREVTLLDWL